MGHCFAVSTLKGYGCGTVEQNGCAPGGHEPSLEEVTLLVCYYLCCLPSLFHARVKFYLDGSNLSHGLMQPRIAMKTAQQKTVNLLRTL